MRALVAAALVAALPLASANAEIIRVDYEGILPGSSFGLPDDIPIMGTYSFDSESSPNYTGNSAIYPLLSHRITIDGSTPINGSSGILKIFNDVDNTSAGYIDEYAVTSTATAIYNGVMISGFGLYLTAYIPEPGGPLTSLDLPLTLMKEAFSYTAVFVDLGGFSWEGSLTRLEFRTLLAAECEGFAPPFDAPIGLNKREQRVIPLRMELFDEDGFPLGPADITAPPTVSVSFDPGTVDIEFEPPQAEWPGNATPGNSFRWDAATERWAFNLSTRPYTAAGRYTVTAVASDEEYALDPTCTGTFARR
jgi:hypothetical protein